jgi:polar amino acid transport system substrate-binding protein
VSCWQSAFDKGCLNAVLIDITDLKRSLEELGIKDEQLVQAEKLAALGTLVAGVAHEINNPTSFITMNVPILREAWEQAAPVFEEYRSRHGDFRLAGLDYDEIRQEIPTICDDILARARNISKIVMDLKDFARERTVNFWGDIDLNDVLRVALVLTQNMIKKVTRNFRLQICHDLPTFKGDPQKLEQVIINLIVNACQALPSDGRGIFISTGFDEPSKCVFFAVEDEGIGIQKEHLPLIFNPFFTTKQETWGGTGLGLSISYGIVRDHGGDLVVTSEPGRGTVAKILLPVDRSG